MRARAGAAQMCVLDGNSYDAKCLEAGQERDDDLDACSLLINNKQQPLLVPGSGGVHSAAQKVIVGLAVRAPLPVPASEPLCARGGAQAGTAARACVLPHHVL